MFYKACLGLFKWGRKAWHRHLWNAAGPSESFTLFPGRKLLSWTAVDGAMDDPAIKTLVEELCDLDSIGQIFCLALGQLLWFVMPLFSCWKMGTAGLICLAEVRGDRWSGVLGYKIEKLKSSQESKAAASAPESFWESRIQVTQGSSPTTREAGRSRQGSLHSPSSKPALSLPPRLGDNTKAPMPGLCLSHWPRRVSRSRTGAVPWGFSMACASRVAAKTQSWTPFLHMFQNVLVLHSVQNVISKSSAGEH